MHANTIKALNRLGLLRFLNLTCSKRVNGRTFRLPLRGRLGSAAVSTTERWMIDLLGLLLPLGEGTFVDVGVNLGQTLVKLRSVSDDTPYLGFEPNPRCVGYVLDLIAANGFEDCRVVPAGISASSGVARLEFYLDDATDASASMIPDFRPTKSVKRIEFVPILRVDELGDSVDLDRISILKIDVEGAEAEVVEAFRNRIQQDRPIVLMEVLPVYDAGNEARLRRQEKVEAVFTEAGYAWFRIRKDPDKVLGLEGIDSIGVHGNVDDSEYVIVPGEKREALLGALERAGLALRSDQEGAGETPG